MPIEKTHSGPSVWEGDHYRTVFENTGTATMIMEADTTVSKVNREFELLSGYSKQDIEGRMSWTRFVHPDDVDRMKAYHYRRRRNPEDPPNVYEFIFVDRLGVQKNILLRVGLIPGTGQSVGSLMDITARRQAEAALESGKETFHNVLEHIEEGYYEVDLKGRFTFVNGPFCRLVELSREHLLTLDNRDYASPKTARRMFEVFNRVFLSGRPSKIRQFEVSLEHRNMVVELTASLIRDPDNNPIGFRGLIRDVTERIRDEARQRENERLQGVLETAGAVCHELNQPLQSIMGYSQLMEMDLPIDHPIRPKLKKVLDAVDKMRQITGNLMKITRYKTMTYLGDSRIIDIEKSANGKTGDGH
ncbi:MAG: PAS domain S-box protein [Pseudomonadota bacterium]